MNKKTTLGILFAILIHCAAYAQTTILDCSGNKKVVTANYTGGVNFQFIPKQATSGSFTAADGTQTSFNTNTTGLITFLPGAAAPVAGDMIQVNGCTFMLRDFSADAKEIVNAQGAVITDKITPDQSFVFLAAVDAAQNTTSKDEFVQKYVGPYKIPTTETKTWQSIAAMVDYPLAGTTLANEATRISNLAPGSNIYFDGPNKAQGNLGALLSGIGGMDVTKVADAFAQFIVKRTKQELNMAFFENFKEQLEKMPYLQSLFPATHKTLTSAGSDIYNYNRYLESLRQSFEEDLSNLLQNTEVWVEGNNQADPLLRLLEVYIPNFRPLMLTSLYFTNQLMNKTHPGLIISNFDESILKELEPLIVPKGVHEIQGIKFSGKKPLQPFTTSDGRIFTSSEAFTATPAECNCTQSGNSITLNSGYTGYVVFGKIYTYRTYVALQGIIPTAGALTFNRVNEHQFTVTGSFNLPNTDGAGANDCNCTQSGNTITLDGSTLYFIKNNTVYVKTVAGMPLKGLKAEEAGVAFTFTTLNDNSFQVNTNPPGKAFTADPKDCHCIATGNTVILNPGVSYNIVGGTNVEVYPSENIVVFDTAKIGQGIRFIKLLSGSFRSTDPEKFWVTPEEVYGKMLQNEKATRYYLTLLYLEARKREINFFKDFIDNNAPAAADLNTVIKNLRADVKAIISKTNSINNSVQLVKKDVELNGKPDIKNLFEFVSSTNDLLNSGLDFAVHTTLPVDTAKINSVRKVLVLISKVTHIAQDISARSYNAAISKTIDLLASYFPRTDDGKRYNDVGRLYKTMEFMNKYGQFMASVVNAKDAKEVSDIIENTVLPPGSSRIKKETEFSISLNAYCGLEGGGERYWIKKRDFSGDDNINHGYFGVSAPIGFAFNWGHSRQKQFQTPAQYTNIKPSGSHTVFLQLFDLGALVAFRFQDSTKLDAKIQLNKIFSPGVSYIYGIPKVPLALKAGVQISPAIKQLNAKEITYQPYTTVRYTLSLLVDIPFFNLYASDKKIKTVK